MMDRRQFIRYVAVTSLASMLPEQIVQLERYYTVNSPKTLGPLIAIDEIFVSGLATHSIPVSVRAMIKERQLLNLGLNIFGGMFRWVALPDSKIITHPEEFFLRLDSREKDVGKWMTGHVRYVDQNAVRHNDPLDKWYERRAETVTVIKDRQRIS